MGTGYHRRPNQPVRSQRKLSLASTKGLLSSNHFFKLLRSRNRKNAGEIDRTIESKCLQKLAILVSDASGFSRRTHEYGILQFLAAMTYCYDRLKPLITRGNGLCLSRNVDNGDNLIAIFADPVEAVQTAINMQLWLRKYNQRRLEAEQFNMCIGIAWGPALRLKHDIFGDKVNMAAKIGEDMASKDEILVTQEVANHVKGRFPREYARSTHIGGRHVELYRVRY